MAGMLTEDTDLEAISTDQRCQSGESLAEWSRSSEQVENGTPSTSPPYYDTDDEDCGPKPSELFGRFTWKIESFSQINKRELRSNSFDVGGYKWYILIYPQGCDVFNHLSLFLCVANHDKLLPGWSHFAQFTIAVVNKDPKKSKYSDTLHRFWKKEHDWGWKKFMELSKLNEGFVVDDVLIIKAQVQVIREKAERPFRCLDCQYRRELVRVYITNIDQICRRFIDDRRLKLSRLVDDKVRWSSFRAFWLSIDPATKRRMSREKTDTILKVLVKHFFAEKEVTSTLVMDSMYSGLKSLEYQSMNKKCFLSNGDEVWVPYPMVYIDQDTFMLADDVVTLIERAVSDTWPQQTAPAKDDKGSQNRTKEGNSGEDLSSVHHYDRDDRRLTELGRRTVEFFALIQIFSRVEVAHQEAVALRRQEELIREEEAAGVAENGKRDKDKRPKKKQSKQKKSGRKGKDKGKNKEKIIVIDDTMSKQEITAAEAENPSEATSDVSEIIDDASEALQLDLDERDSSPVNWETDTSETRQIGASGSEIVNEDKNGKGSAFVDDSSSTCSTDSASAPFKVQVSPNRGRKQLNKNKSPSASAKNGRSNIEADSTSKSSNAAVSLKPEQVAINTVRERVLPNAQQMPDKKEEMVISHAMLKVEEKTETKSLIKPKTMDPSPVSCPVPNKKPSPLLSPQKLTSETTPRATPSNGARTEPIAAPSPSPSLKPTITQSKSSSISSQVGIVSRPLSAPLIPAAQHTVTVSPTSSALPNPPALSRSASSLGRLTNATAHGPRSYRNAMMGTNDAVSTSTNTGTSMPASSASSSPSSSTLPGASEGPIFKFIPVKPEESYKLTTEPISRIDREFERWHTSKPSSEPPLTSTSGAAPDEFPHLDIINDLLDEDMSNGLSVSERHEPYHRLRSFSRQYSMPDHRYSNGYGNGSFGIIGSGVGAGRVAGTGANGSIGSTRHFSHADLMNYSNGYVDEMMPNQWYGHGDISMVDMGDTNGYPYLLEEYSNMMGGVNGYRPMYHPSNGY